MPTKNPWLSGLLVAWLAPGLIGLFLVFRVFDTPAADLPLTIVQAFSLTLLALAGVNFTAWLAISALLHSRSTLAAEVVERAGQPVQ